MMYAAVAMLTIGIIPFMAVLYYTFVFGCYCYYKANGGKHGIRRYFKERKL